MALNYHFGTCLGYCGNARMQRFRLLHRRKSAPDLHEIYLALQH